MTIEIKDLLCERLNNAIECSESDSERRTAIIATLWDIASDLALEEVLQRASVIIAENSFDCFIIAMGTWFFVKGGVHFNEDDEECSYLTDFIDDWGLDLKITGAGIKLLADGSIIELT